MPIDQVWADVWAIIGPLIERAMQGEATRFEDMPLLMTRKGYEEQTYWTFSYSPLRDGSTIVGFLDIATETTETVLARQRAAANGQRVQLALEAGAIMGTWVWDIRADRFEVDEAFAASFGLDPALSHEGLGLEQLMRTVHPDDRQGLADAIAEATARGGAYAHQYRVRRTDGRYYWIEANGRVDLDQDGAAVSFPGVLIDIEGRRAVEAERDRAIARLRALNTDLEQRIAAQSLARGRTWQVSPDIMGVLNADGYFEASNPAWKTTLGWSEEEVASTVFFDFIHADDQEKTQGAWTDALDRGLPALRFENRYRHKDGGWRWLSWVAVPDEGKVYCSARDITAEKEAEVELLARTAERDRLWETTNDLMGTAGLDGYLKAINPAWKTLLGWSERELLDRPFFEIIDPADHAETTLVVERLAAGEVVTGFVDRVICKTGEQRSIMWTATPDPGTDLFHIVGRDVTEQRTAEDALRQSQKMEAVGQLTGGLAHDFNNLLAGISGALELMDTRVRQGRFTELERYMGAAQGATRRAAALTHRLLAFSRRQALAPRPADIGQLAGGMVDLIQRTVGPGIAVTHDAMPGVATVLVDVSQLENALLNLCINARDAMPDGGRISIRTADRVFDAQHGRQIDLPAGDYVELCVSDSGAGMSPDVVAKAFEPFFTTKPTGEGTGLGLSMIYGFAKQSGGQVRIESAVGHGTTVCIYLPRYIGEALAEIPDGARAPVTRAESGETILIVDDEPTVRMLLTEMIEELGFSIIEAKDAVAGLKVLESNVRIDLLVTDIGLPGGMNGRQMADAARLHRPGLKVLFITGYAEGALVNNGRLQPGTALLTKPFAMDTLVERLGELLRSDLRATTLE